MQGTQNITENTQPHRVTMAINVLQMTLCVELVWKMRRYWNRIAILMKVMDNGYGTVAMYKNFSETGESWIQV